MSESLLDVLILLSLAVLFVVVARQLRLPSLLAYLAIGILVGPHGLELVAESEAASHFAEFGVVFLMFSIGLEFSLTRLKAMHRLVFGLGAAQVGVTLIGTTAVTVMYYGQDWRIGLAVGAACAMSSTAIVSKMLSERLELHSQPGRQTMAVLLFQDLAVVPLLIVIPALSADARGMAGALSLALGQALLALLAMILVGQRVMRRWFDAVARQKSPELFMLNVLWVVVGLSTLTAWAGLSLALGAFIGGMLISETLYRHQVEADIRPFRDVLLGLFFVTIGMLLDVDYVLSHLGGVALALALLILAKGGIVMLLTRLLGNSLEVGIRTSIQLAQAGEFGFVLLELARDQKLLPPDVFQVTMAAMLLSMFVAPLLIARATRIGKHLSRSEWADRTRMIHEVASHSMGIEGHVILCGFGRTGQNIARFLDKEGIPFIALDMDAGCIRQAVEAGENVVYGNADRREILTAAGVERARAVVVTYADLPATEKVLHLMRELKPELPVIVRARDDAHLEQLKALGATEVIPEVLEGSLMLAAQTLTQLGIPVERALEQVREVRANRYTALRAFYRGESDRLRDREQRLMEEKLAFVIEPQSHACGQRLGDLALTQTGVRLEALRRQRVRHPDPDPETRLAAEDVLILVGRPEQLEAAERLLLAGA
ncbi:MAG: monovalent cation:proton antiporter-2 (CPA2) family protein [Betaproteobacteria bacterium]|nr:monovalent cation:proton antiporter-2 (CPA2) family protein [Betaproteobacteria bacterium]